MEGKLDDDFYGILFIFLGKKSEINLRLVDTSFSNLGYVGYCDGI